MRQMASHAGDIPVEVDLTRLALKRLLFYVALSTASELRINTRLVFGRLPPSDIRDIYHFSTKYELAIVKTDLETMAQEALDNISRIEVYRDNDLGAPPFGIRRRDFKKLVRELHLSWSVLSTLRVMEALPCELVIPCLRAAFGENLRPLSSFPLPSEALAEEFEKVFTMVD